MPPRQTPASTPRKRLSADARRAQLEDVARRVFVRNGLAGARTKEIAEEAGVAEAIIYRHFETKEALFEASVLGPIREMVQRIVELSEGLPELTDRERNRESLEGHQAILRAMIEIAPLLGAALFGDQGQGTVFFEDSLGPLLKSFEQATERTLSTVTAPVDARVVADMVLGTYFWMAIRSRHDSQPISVDETTRQVLETLLHGLVPRPAKRN
jgi:AcrR family transcriptional regulator